MDMDISENLKRISFEIEEAKAKFRKSGDNVRIMAVTKTVPYARVNEAVKEGITLLGENRVQEYLEKKDFYDKSAEVHFIGHLQTNKIKYIADSVTMIHSVDSARLAAEIDRQAGKVGKRLDVLLEVNIGGEDTKSGVDADRLEELFEEASQLENISIRGLMTIPPVGKSEEAFEKMQRLFEDMKSGHIGIDTLSMGMSSDYALAVKYGSNIVRIGSRIFGARK
ncbi:MAG: YggS family pyridoxal phosphate-dependent enzyme [Oscillospiraceae bacterium]|nr:YggS family pyridoxal phosphate-dependent enzyme [Oscillospiraceae bacterium]